MNETKIFNLMDSIGKIDAKIVEESDRAFALARVRRMRKMKAVIISAACIALAASMAVASFFWLNKPDGDMTGLTPPNNANGVTPDVTPVLPSDDTDDSLSDKIEMGAGAQTSPFVMAFSIDKEFPVLQEKVPITISVGLNDFYSDNYDVFQEFSHGEPLVIYADFYSYGHDGIAYDIKHADRVYIYEIANEDFMKENNFYYYIETVDDNGNTVKKRAFKNAYELYINMEHFESIYDMGYRTTVYGFIDIYVAIGYPPEGYASLYGCTVARVKYKIEEGKLILGFKG